ncbi:hypothetical protein GV790_19300 [Nocardia cyriacigeorgica]|nr:hypothetical protein [Nocardia cyriacigeorgica]
MGLIMFSLVLIVLVTAAVGGIVAFVVAVQRAGRPRHRGRPPGPYWAAGGSGYPDGGGHHSGSGASCGGGSSCGGGGSSCGGGG